jgi:hypothetical protein
MTTKHVANLPPQRWSRKPGRNWRAPVGCPTAEDASQVLATATVETRNPKS